MNTDFDDPNLLLAAQIVVAGNPLSDNYVESAVAAKRRGSKLVACLTDLHPKNTTRGKRYAEIVAHSDAVVVQTPTHADWTKKEFGVEPVIIPEPVEYPSLEPAFAPDPRKGVRVVWYGSASNQDALDSALQQLFQRTERLYILLISNRFPNVLNSLKPPTNCRIDFWHWSRGAQFQALSDCDFVIVPSIPDRPEKEVKGPNRVTEALHVGRAVIASPMSQYQPYRDYALLTNDFSAGIGYGLKSPDEMYKRCVAGQAAVKQMNGPGVVCGMWEDLFDTLLA
jgi:glycosyltransferase involved in cell wall biosynthesis